MHLADLASVYREKTDEELLELARQRDSLTEEGRHVLAAELAVRRLTTEILEAPASRDHGYLEPAIARPMAAQFATRDFIEEVFRFYSRNRLIFIKLAFPAVLVGTVAIIVARYELLDIRIQLVRNDLQPRPAMYEAFAWTWSRDLVNWLAVCMSFAAISVATEQILAGLEATVRESFEVMLRRIIPLLGASLLLLIILVGIEGGIILALFGTASGALRDFGRVHPLAIRTVTYAAFAIGPLVVSRFSLAIPAIVLDDCSVGQAVFRSDELTKGKWSILALLMLKSVVGGYVAGMLPFWLARLIPSSVALPPGFGWFLTATSVVVVTIVEPFMFIGFAFLYLKTTPASAQSEVQAMSAG